MPVKALQKRPVAAVIMVLAIVASVFIGQVKKPESTEAPSTAIVGTYKYTYDEAGVLTDETMTYIDEMNASLFAQTGAQIVVQTVKTTGGPSAVDYAYDLGDRYGVGSAERDNGLVLVLALEDYSQSGLLGDYGLAVGDGLLDYQENFYTILDYDLEPDFAAGDYDAGVRATIEEFMSWMERFYNVSIRPGYIPPVRESFSTSSGYYTESYGYFEPTIYTTSVTLVELVIIALLIWWVLDGFRWRRYRRRYLMPGMGIPTRRYYPVFWGRSYGRPRPVRQPYNPGGRGDSFGGGSFDSGRNNRTGGSRGSFGGGSFSAGRSSRTGGSRSSFGGGSFSSGRSSSRSSGSRRSGGGGSFRSGRSGRTGGGRR